MKDASQSTFDRLHDIADEVGDTARETRQQLGSAAEAAGDAAKGLFGSLRGSAKEAIDTIGSDAKRSRDLVESCISDNPWRAAAVIGVAGLLIGALVSSRRQ